MIGAVKHTFREILSDLRPKHLVVGAGVLFITAWGFSRLLPGAAARMGLRPRPLFPDYQSTWPEPFGLVPVLPFSFPGASGSAAATSAPASSSSGLTQAQIGQAIINATTASLPASSGDILQNITSGNA